MRQNSSAQLRIQEKLTEEGYKDQVKQDRFDIGVNIKRWPDISNQLSIKGEY